MTDSAPSEIALARAMTATGRGHALLEAGEFAGAQDAYRQAAALAPGNAAAHFNLANALARGGAVHAALTSFAVALAIDPDHAPSRLNRGNLHRALGDPTAALADYLAAAALMPGDPGPAHNIGTVLLDLDRTEEALAWFYRAAAAEPPFPPAIACLAEALLRLDRPEEARTWFRAARRHPNQRDIANFGIALADLTLGRLSDGFARFESRFGDAAIRNSLPQVPPPFWNGTDPVAGRHVLLLAEQGMGDAIMFARYAPILRARGARVTLMVHAPLLALLGPLAEAVLPLDAPPPPHDLAAPLMSLPRLLGTSSETVPASVPYLHADPARRARWQARLGAPGGRRIGLAWSGNPAHRMNARRSIPLAALAPLRDLPGVSLHALHQAIPPQDRPMLGTIIDHGAELTDFAETAALIAELDLVVTVDTAIAHLAGALGVPVWLLLPRPADYRWMRERSDSPWYPTMRLWRQERIGAWAPVIAALAAALARLGR